MDSIHSETSKNGKQQPERTNPPFSDLASALLKWWYWLAAPSEPSVSASLSERERARRGRVASLFVSVFMLLLLTILLCYISDHQSIQVVTAVVVLVGSGVGLYLNRRGLVEAAGIVILLLIYVGSSIVITNYPRGLSMDTLFYLYSGVIPLMISLSFFPAINLLIVLCLNIILGWVAVMYGPHDVAIAHLLLAAPLKIFFPILILQIVTAITLYFWARSAEKALKRADWAEKLAAAEKREKEYQERELERKRQLEAGIQQILQTHVAVANGDFNVRAPLQQDHLLWQVAAALNNLIGRLQSVSQREWELKQLQARGGEGVSLCTTGQHPAVKRDTDKIPRTPLISGPAPSWWRKERKA